jgi:dUTPase
MKLLIQDETGLSIPKQAHEGEDAAYDVIATTPPRIVGDFKEGFLGEKLYSRLVYIEYGTNLFISPEVEIIQEPKSFCSDASGAICDIIWRYREVNYHVKLFPRSSISKYNLSLANCVPIIDGGYRNQILLRFKYYFQPEDLTIIEEKSLSRIYGVVNQELIYQQNNAICQMEAHPNIPIEFERVKTLPPSSRKLTGFGDSDKKR